MYDLSTWDLPDSVKNSQVYTPLEDIALAVLRLRLPDMTIYGEIPFAQSPAEIPHGTFAVVRRTQGMGLWRGRESLLDFGNITTHVFTKDPDGDAKGAIVSEAIREAFFAEAHDRTFFPGLGGIAHVRMDQEPIRRTDWATSAGPIQYADLPTGYWRYEAQYALWVRPPLRS